MQMKIVFCLFALLLTACSTLETDQKEVPSIFAKIEGAWGTVDPTSFSCEATPQIFSVSSDYSHITIRSASQLAAGGEASNTISYKVLAVHGNVLTMFIEGEQRKTDSGDPVVWSLVLANDREFRWRQTDWPKGDHTRPFKRCD